MSYRYGDHLSMMRDARRLDAYRRALAAVVRPGDTVLDLGAGAGVMTFLALAAGAAKVYAIEPSDNIAVLAKVARAAGLGSRIALIQDDSRAVTLPSPADVVVADLRGALPILGCGLEVLADARKRHLRAGGRMIPLEDRIAFAPVSCAEVAQAVSGWRMVVGQADYAPMVTVAASQLRGVELAADAPLADPALTAALAYDRDPPAKLVANHRFRAARQGVCHGIGAWFEVTLAPGITLSTAPALTASTYGKAVFPLAEAVELREGDGLDVELSCGLRAAEPIWSWEVASVARPRAAVLGRRDDRVDGGAAAARRLARARARRRRRRALLCARPHERSHAAGRHRARASRAFPARFASADDALAYVGELSVRYGA